MFLSVVIILLIPFIDDNTKLLCFYEFLLFLLFFNEIMHDLNWIISFIFKGLKVFLIKS